LKYLGGKARIAKELAAFIASRHGDRWLFVEPFMGGANMTVELAKHFRYGFASDAVPDLALLYNAVQAGWVPPTEVSPELYASLRHAEPSALRAFVGFGCSRSGIWFSGFVGRVERVVKGKHHVDNPVQEITGALRRLRDAAPHVEFTHRSYDAAGPIEGAVAYCDPPYASTTGYQQGAFDTAKFWATMRQWRAAGMHVYVSEYQAPDDWRCVWEKPKKLGMRASDGTQRLSVERLYV
jgi:DNA adenine methylase